jgi:hypothetical protein
MMRATLFCTLGLFLAAEAHAQEGHAFLIHAGATIPTSEYGEAFGPGPNVGGALELEITPRMRLQGAAGFYSLPILAQRGRESGFSAVGNLKVLLRSGASHAAPYLLGGAGVWRTGLSDVWVTTEGVIPRRDRREESRFALNFGAGVIVIAGGRAGLFAQVRRVIVSGDAPSIRMVPLEFGVSFPGR